MEDILFIKYSETFRTQERWEKICRHRSELYDLIEYNSCLSEQSIFNKWDRSFERACNIVNTDFVEAENADKLTWFEVMEQDYHPIGE